MINSFKNKHLSHINSNVTKKQNFLRYSLKINPFVAQPWKLTCKAVLLNPLVDESFNLPIT